MRIVVVHPQKEWSAGFSRRREVRKNAIGRLFGITLRTIVSEILVVDIEAPAKAEATRE